MRVLGTSSERGFVAASGFLDVDGLKLPLQSNRCRIAVGGAGVVLTVTLTRAQLRRARRALSRRRRVGVRLGVVATDLAGRSRATRSPGIRLRL